MLKSLLAVQVSFRRLLAAKMAAGALMTLLYSIMQWALSLLLCGILKLSGLNPVSAADTLGRMLGANLCVYMAVLPIIALTAAASLAFVCLLTVAVLWKAESRCSKWMGK